MIKAVVGANWGDEGKGKLTDVFAKESDIVVRFQGGNNAGHTIINDYGKFALHMLPSGVFYNHITSLLYLFIRAIWKWCKAKTIRSYNCIGVNYTSRSNDTFIIDLYS